MNTQVMTVEANPSFVRTTHIVYALHAWAWRWAPSARPA